jgi:hypothetical protein
MKKATSLVLPGLAVIAICLFYPLFSQSNINNHSTPANPDAGYVKKIKFLAAAHDDSGDYVFKAPKYITLIDDGTFWVADNSQVLRFGADGNFLQVMVKKGQGPGEATYISQVLKRKKDIIVTDCYMSKLMIFGFDGQLMMELKVPNLAASKGLSSVSISFFIMGSSAGGNLIVFSYGLPDKDGNPRDKTLTCPMFLLDEKMQWKKLPSVLSLDAEVFKTSSRKIYLNKNGITSASNENYIFISNSERYEIKLFSIEKMEFTATWRRDYSPVKIPTENRSKYAYGSTYIVGLKGKALRFEVSLREDFLDIQRIFLVGNQIWIITSTFDNSKGILVDIFDQQGKYIDNFYLKLPPCVDGNGLFRNKIQLDKRTLLIRERDEEDNYRIVKYMIKKSQVKRGYSKKEFQWFR